MHKIVKIVFVILVLLTLPVFAQLPSTNAGLSNTVPVAGVTSPPANQEYNCDDTDVNTGDYWTPTPGTSSYAECIATSSVNVCGLHICDAQINPNHQRLRDGVVNKIIPNSGVLGVGSLSPFGGITPALYAPETSTYLTLRHFNLPNVPLYGKGASYTTLKSTTIHSLSADEDATIDAESVTVLNNGKFMGSSDLKAKTSTINAVQEFTDHSTADLKDSRVSTLKLSKSSTLTSKNTNIGNLHLESTTDNTKLIITKLKPGTQTLPIASDTNLPTVQVIPQYSAGASSGTPQNLASERGGITASLDGGQITGTINFRSAAPLTPTVPGTQGQARILNHIRDCSYINGETYLGKDTLTVIGSDDTCSQRTVETLKLTDNAIVKFSDENTLSDSIAILAPALQTVVEDYKNTRVNNLVVESGARGVIIRGDVDFEGTATIQTGAVVKRSFPIYVTVTQGNVKLPLALNPLNVKVKRVSDNADVCGSTNTVSAVATGGAYIETCDVSFNNPNERYYLHVVDAASGINLNGPRGFNEFSINTDTPIPIQIQLPIAPTDVKLWTPTYAENDETTWPIIVTWKDNSGATTPITTWYYGDPALNVISVPATTQTNLPQNTVLTNVQPAPELGFNYYKATIPTGNPDTYKDICIQGESLGGTTACVNGVNQNNPSATFSYRIYSLAQVPQTPSGVPDFNTVVLTWSNGRNPVTVTYCAEISGSSTCSSQLTWTNLLTQTFTGLYANKEYSFDVYAKNSDNVITSPSSTTTSTLARTPSSAQSDPDYQRTSNRAKIKWDDGRTLTDLGNDPLSIYNVHKRTVTPVSSVNRLSPIGFPVAVSFLDIVSPVSEPEIIESADGNSLAVEFTNLACATHYSFDIKVDQIATGTETATASSPADVFTLPTYTSGSSEQNNGGYTNQQVWTFNVDACTNHFHYYFGPTDDMPQILSETDKVVQYSQTDTTLPQCWYDVGTSVTPPISGQIKIKCSIGNAATAKTGEWSLKLLPHNNCAVTASLGGGAVSCNGGSGDHEGTRLGEDVSYPIVGGLLDLIAPVSDIDSTFLNGYHNSDVSIPVNDCDDGLTGTTCAPNSDAPQRCEYRIIEGARITEWTNRICDTSFAVSVGQSSDCRLQTPLGVPGTCRVEVRSVDKAGTVSNVDSVDLQIDYEAPQIQDLNSLTIENRWYSNYADDAEDMPPSVNFACADAGSGSATCNQLAPTGIEFCIVNEGQTSSACVDGVNVFDYSSATGAAFNPATATGFLCNYVTGNPSSSQNMHCKFKMYARATDPAGNMGDWVLSNYNAQTGNPSLRIDNFVPVGEVIASSASVYISESNKAKLRVPAVEKNDIDPINGIEGSGIVSYKFSVTQDSSSVTQASSVYDQIHTPNSLRTVKVEYIDGVGTLGSSDPILGSVTKRLLAVRGEALTQTDSGNPNAIRVSLKNDENDNAVDYAIRTTNGYLTPAGLVQPDPFYASKSTWIGERSLSGLDPNRQYEFQVFTRNLDSIITDGINTHKYTRAAAIEEPAGSNLGATAHLRWSDETDQGTNPPTTRHKIERQDGNSWILVEENAQGSSYVDDTVTCINCNTLTYRITSKNEENEPSTAVSVVINRPFTLSLNTYGELSRGVHIPARGVYYALIDEINAKVVDSSAETVNDGIDRPGALTLVDTPLSGPQTSTSYYVWHVGSGTSFTPPRFAKTSGVTLEWCEINTPTASMCDPTQYRPIDEPLYGAGVVIKVTMTRASGAAPAPYLYWLQAPIDQPNS